MRKACYAKHWLNETLPLAGISRHFYSERRAKWRSAILKLLQSAARQQSIERNESVAVFLTGLAIVDSKIAV